jgi:predicted regulator of Ras-like GTPase activity (Roadblock/LC7/MglB family)
LIPTIQRLSADSFCGQLLVYLEEDHVGTIVFHHGSIAWAVSKSQSENLGTFLQRLGHVSKQQLLETQKTYTKRNGKRKFGKLLEDAGLISKPVLRRCLLLHTKRALQALQAILATKTVIKEGALVVEEDMTFSLEELMLQANTKSIPITSEWSVDNIVLKGFSEIPGDRAVALISKDGELLAAHAHKQNCDSSIFGVCLATVLDDAIQVSRASSLGAVDYLFLDCCEGSLVSRWLDEKRDCLIAVIIDKDGQIGGTKYRIDRRVDNLLKVLH